MSVYSKDIDTGIFTSNLAVGSNTGGYDYGFVGDLSHRVKEMSILLNKDLGNIGRIIIKKYDMTCITVGGNHGMTEGGSQPSGTSSQNCWVTWNFEPEEQLTRIRLYSREDRLVGIKISSNRQQNLSACLPGVTDTNPTPVEIPVGSGKWVGIFGFSGAHVDSLGFAMLKN